jgi:hypothetical protein
MPVPERASYLKAGGFLPRAWRAPTGCSDTGSRAAAIRAGARRADLQSTMLLRLRILLCALVVGLVAPAAGLAAGGNYAFDGGTAGQRAQVKAALDVSAFDWSLVPARIVVHIKPGIDSEATRGEIWLDARLLDSGRFSWGVVQHEYAHQVDFFLLDDAKRQELAGKLGGSAWWAPAGRPAMSPNGTLAHAQLSSERFASTLAWTYWPSPDNSMRPQSPTDESAAMAPPALRTELAGLIGASFAPVRTTTKR